MSSVRMLWYRSAVRDFFSGTRVSGMGPRREGGTTLYVRSRFDGAGAERPFRTLRLGELGSNLDRGSKQSLHWRRLIWRIRQGSAPLSREPPRCGFSLLRSAACYRRDSSEAVSSRRISFPVAQSPDGRSLKGTRADPALSRIRRGGHTARRGRIALGARDCR